LVCSGIQTSDTNDLISGYRFPTEKKDATKTYKFKIENRIIEKNNSSEEKLVWVLNADSQPEIFEENKTFTQEIHNIKEETHSFKFVFVRKDDISVKNIYSKDIYSKDEKNIRKNHLSYSLDVDRISGKFSEKILDSSKSSIQSETFEGSCTKMKKNLI
jgi:hypothetical protein